MKMLDNLSDNELVDYIIKHDDDPVRVRLATHMQRVAGAIIDDLVRAGMDETFCNFRSVVTETEFHPGRYISHLENEIQYLNEMAVQNLKEIAELQARTIGDLIAELKQEIKTADYREKEAVKRMTEAYAEHQDMKSKLDMWTILKR
jgi:hypothetical protein